MKKLTLELDRLAVESFATGEAEAIGGTVEAREAGRTAQLTCQTTPYCKTILTYCPCTPRAEDFFA